jgi:hypothetical protein
MTNILVAYLLTLRERETALSISQSSDVSRSSSVEGKSASKALIGGTTFHFVFLGTVLWFIAGSYLDAWAHNNIPSLETFFTPWHGALYSGMLATAAVLFITILINHRRGASWSAAIPKGYDISALGVTLMFFAGIGDGFWHTLFGIEKNIDGVLSPTHIALMISITLIILGPYRALSSRKGALSKTDQTILVLTFTLLLALFTNITQAMITYTRLWPVTMPASNSDGQLLAVVSFVLQGLLLAGSTLVVLRRWRLPLGFFTFSLTVVAFGISFMQYQFVLDIPMGIISGLLLDISYYFLKPTFKRELQFRLFCVLLCSITPAVYLVLVRLIMGPLLWTIHLTIGSVVVCALFGWLLSYVAYPSASFTEAQE